MKERMLDADVVIIGGGPAGSTLGSLLGRDGHRVVILERDIHPREHVGEALTPSTNNVLHDLGVLPKIEEAGFVHKRGVGWSAPYSPLWKFFAVRTADYPPPNAIQPYSYNVEREDFDALLLRHALEIGAKVLQGVSVKRVLFEEDRAVGVHVAVADGWERDLYAKVVVDASGRQCVLGKQLGKRSKDPEFNQFAIYSWFTGVEPPPAQWEGFLILHFLGWERAWGWHIPLRNGVTSMGVVTDKADFQKSGKSPEEFFDGLISRNRTFRHAMRHAVRVRPWSIEGDYSYSMDTVAGKGWLFIGDAMRFVDPIFASGVDVALYSTAHAHQAIVKSLTDGHEERAFGEFASRVTDGLGVWYELTVLFYKLQLLFTWFVRTPEHRADLIRILQGNPYMPEIKPTDQRLADLMWKAYEQIMANPHNLLRPGALDELRAAAS